MRDGTRFGNAASFIDSESRLVVLDRKKLRGIDAGTDALPVGAFPEELVAVGALKELVEPLVGAGRDALAGSFFVDFDEFAAATHAAGFVGVRKI